MSARTDIRTYVTGLLTGTTDAGARVYKTRYKPILDSLLEEGPVLLIYAKEEDPEVIVEDVANRVYTRDLTLMIEGNLTASEDMDDDMDTLAEQIEALIEASKPLKDTRDGAQAAVSKNVVLEKTEFGINNEGAFPVGIMRLSYSVTYYD